MGGLLLQAGAARSRAAESAALTSSLVFEAARSRQVLPAGRVDHFERITCTRSPAAVDELWPFGEQGYDGRFHQRSSLISCILGYVNCL